MDRGEHIMTSTVVREKYDPLLHSIRDLLERGQQEGAFRANVDAVALYISIASLTAHYVINSYTFEPLFGQNLTTAHRITHLLNQAAEMVLWLSPAGRTAFPYPPD